MMSDGQPAIGANVKTTSEETRYYHPGASQAWTDGSGNYILHGLKQGKAMIEATHKEAPRQVKDIELKSGSNRLDFQLESGYAVSGRIQDESGAGLSNVGIRIYVPSIYGLTATTAEDGTTAPAEETVVEVPTTITLIVTPQDAITLNYLVNSSAQLTLALRGAGDEQIAQTEAVTLQYLLDHYGIPVPAKLSDGIEPRTDQLINPLYDIIPQ
jgi:hypothetical protein